MSMSSSSNSLPYSANGGGYSTHDTLVLLGIVVCATAVSIVIIVLGERLLCHHRRAAGGAIIYVGARPFFMRRGGSGGDGDGDGGLSPSAVATLPSFVYHRGVVVATGSNNGDGRGEGSGGGRGRGWAQCVVCLSLVQAGEVVRQLPACMHLFHVGCIDMWLHSHSTCPLCRTTVKATKEAPSKDQVPPV